MTIGRSKRGVLLSVGVVGLCAAAWALPPAPEAAMSRTVQDATLQWGPCPEFMPKGCGISVLHGDPAKPNADIFFRVPGKAKIPSHWHTSAERMMLVEGEMQVTYAGQAPTTLKPGTYAYGPAKLEHDATCTSASPCVLFIAFEGPVDAHPSGAGAKPAGAK
jgi:quercetin dioxygenase-like cupin family protein